MPRKREPVRRFKGWRRTADGKIEEYRVKVGDLEKQPGLLKDYFDETQRVGRKVGRQKKVTFIKAKKMSEGLLWEEYTRLARSTDQQSQEGLEEAPDRRAHLWEGPEDDAAKYSEISRAIKKVFHKTREDRKRPLPILEYIELYTDYRGGHHLIMSAPHVVYDLRAYSNGLECSNPKEYAEQLGIALGGRHSVGYTIPEYHASLSDIHDIEEEGTGIKHPVIIDVGNLIKLEFNKPTYAMMGDELTECLRYLPKEVHKSFFEYYFKTNEKHKDRILKAIKYARDVPSPRQVFAGAEIGEVEITDDYEGIRHELWHLKKEGKLKALEKALEKLKQK